MVLKWQNSNSLTEKSQKTTKICHFFSRFNFDLIFRGYALMSREWVQCIQWCSKHWIFIFRSENDHSDTLYPLNLAWSNSGQKSLNKPKIDRFGLFNPLKWACIVKIITIYVPDEFWDIRRQKVLIKFFFSFFHRKSMIFQKKISKTPKTTYFSSEIQSDGFHMWF